MRKLICDFCGIEKTGHHRYMKTCGDKDCIQKSRKQTNLDKYGHVNNLHGEEGRKKVLSTLKSKYGENIENVSQIPEIKEKKRKKCLSNFGVEWPMQSKEVQQKSLETVLDKYGVDNVSKCKEIIDKIKYKLTQIDPESGLTIIETAKIKREDTYLEKFGLKHYFQSDDFKEKMKNIMLEKYGVDNVFKSEYFDLLMKKRGFRYEDHSQFERFNDYRRIVKKLTERTFRENFDILSILYLRGTDYHLDHIYSIYQGFIDNIEPEIMASVINLQLIPSKINKSKSTDCWITKDELFTLYNNLNKKNYE